MSNTFYGLDKRFAKRGYKNWRWW